MQFSARISQLPRLLGTADSSSAVPRLQLSMQPRVSTKPAKPLKASISNARVQPVKKPAAKPAATAEAKLAQKRRGGGTGDELEDEDEALGLVGC